MKKRNFFVNLFFSASIKRKEFQDLLDNLNTNLSQLERKIKEIEMIDNKVLAIIELFRLISPLQDEGGFSQQIEEIKKNNKNGNFDGRIKALEVLNLHIEKAGRGAMNRTTKGETVSVDNVFLGNLYGLFTHSARYWLNKKKELEATYRPDISKDPNGPVSVWYLINDHQCGRFVDSHATGIKKQIKLLKAA